MKNMLWTLDERIFFIKWQRTELCFNVLCKVQFVRDEFGYLAENVKLCESSAWFLLTDYGKCEGRIIN